MSDPTEHVRDYAEWLTAKFELFDAAALRKDDSAPSSAESTSNESGAQGPMPFSAASDEIATLELKPTTIKNSNAAFLRAAAAILAVAVLGAGLFAARHAGSSTDSTVDAPPASAIPAAVWAIGSQLRFGPRGLSAVSGDPPLVWTGTEMVLVGVIPRPPVPDVFPPLGSSAAYNPRTNKWRIIPTPLYAITFVTSAVWTGREILVFGESETSGVPPSLVVASLDPVTDAWAIVGPPTATTGYGPGSQHSTGAVWMGDRVILTSAYGQIVSYSRSTNTRELLVAGERSLSKRWRIGQFVGSKFVLIHAASDGSDHAESAQLFDVDTRKYEPIALPPFTPDAVATSGSSLVGSRRDGRVAVWSQATNTWRLGAKGPQVPNNMSDRSCVESEILACVTTLETSAWTSDRFTIFDQPFPHGQLSLPTMGTIPNRATDGTGGIYDPATDNWSPIPAIGGNVAWTRGIVADGQMMIWGYALGADGSRPDSAANTVATRSIRADQQLPPTSPTPPPPGTAQNPSRTIRPA